MRKLSEINRFILKFLLLSAVFACFIAAVSLPSFAEMGTFTFEMTEEPVYIDVKTTDEIIDFYQQATTEDLLSKKTNTYVKRQIIISESAKPVEKDVVVHSFRISDITETDVNSAQDSLNEIIEEVFLEITSDLGKKYVSTIVYLYGASYSMTYDPETGEVSELFLHVALVVGEGVEEINGIIENYVRPNADNWRDLPKVKQILELNSFMLDGRFSYDTSLTQRKSTYAFIRDGKGVCEEYAGLTSLFLDELGFENILVRGFTKNKTELEEHVWNLVNIDGNWYHLDILWDGPIDENGNHTEVTTDYLLKSNASLKGNHLVSSIYYPYTELARYDCDLSEYLVPETPPESETPPEPEEPDVTPEIELNEARTELAAALDAAYDVLYRNYYMYTAESVDRIMPYYTDAKAVYDNQEATLEEIKNQTNSLSFATQNYAEQFVPADKSSLYRYLSQAYGVLLYDYELYDRATVEALIEPYEAAVTVYQNEYATQREVDNARNNLRTYVKALILLETENPDENAGSSLSSDTRVINPDDLRIIPNLPFVPGSATEETDPPEENTEPTDPENGEQTGTEENPEDPENSEQQPEQTETTEPQQETEGETTPPEPEENSETNENTEQEENLPSEANNDPAESVTPNIEPQKESAFESFMKSDMLIYIIIALVALGGILYLVFSKARRKEEEPKYILLDDDDSEDDDSEDDDYEDVDYEDVETIDELQQKAVSETDETEAAAEETKPEEKTDVDVSTEKEEHTADETAADPESVSESETAPENETAPEEEKSEKTEETEHEKSSEHEDVNDISEEPADKKTERTEQGEQ